MDLDALRRRIAMLRNKTEANGATAGEARNAAAKADELERRYGVAGERPGVGGHGPTVIVTIGQYRAMERGGVATVVKGRSRHRYRIDEDELVRWTPADGESRHRICRVSMQGRHMVIRHAG